MAGKRRTTWVDTSPNGVIVVGTQFLVGIDGNPSVSDGQGRTLTRVIGNISFACSTVAGAWGIQSLSVGIGAASREAMAATVVPDPGSIVEEPTLGWIYRDIIMVTQNGIGTPVVAARMSFDLHAQRRLDSGRHYLVIDNAAELGTSSSVLVVGLVRALYLLP